MGAGRGRLAPSVEHGSRCHDESRKTRLSASRMHTICHEREALAERRGYFVAKARAADVVS